MQNYFFNFFNTCKFARGKKTLIIIIFCLSNFSCFLVSNISVTFLRFFSLSHSFSYHHNRSNQLSSTWETKLQSITKREQRWLLASQYYQRENDICPIILWQLLYNHISHTYLMFLLSFFLSFFILFLTNKKREKKSCHNSCHLLVVQISLHLGLMINEHPTHHLNTYLCGIVSGHIYKQKLIF